MAITKPQNIVFSSFDCMLLPLYFCYLSDKILVLLEQEIFHHLSVYSRWYKNVIYLKAIVHDQSKWPANQKFVQTNLHLDLTLSIAVLSIRPSNPPELRWVFCCELPAIFHHIQVEFKEKREKKKMIIYYCTIHHWDGKKNISISAICLFDSLVKCNPSHLLPFVSHDFT